MIDSKKEHCLAVFDAALGLQQIGEHQRALDILQQVADRARDRDTDFALEENDLPLVQAQLSLLKGISYQELGRLEEAEDSLRSAIRWRPEYPEALQALGLLLFARGRWPESAEVLKKHLQHEPASLLTLRALGSALLRQGREDEAAQTFRRAWKRTADERIGIEAGRFLLSVRRPDEGRHLLQEVVEEHESAGALTELAAALAMQTDCATAIAALQRALDEDPTYARAWRGLAYCHTLSGDLDQALEAAKTATHLDTSDPRNWHGQARVLLHANRPNEALEAIQRGMEQIDVEDDEASPVLRGLLLQRTEALAKAGMPQEVLAHVTEARDRFPDDEPFLFQQTAILFNQGMYEAALAILAKARKDWTHDDSSLAELQYWALHGTGCHEEALSVIKPHLAQSPSERLTRLAAIGVTLYGQGRPPAARAVYEQLLGFAPDEPRVLNNLAFILSGEGELLRAQSLFLRALETAQSSELRSVAHANAGYLYLLEGKCERAGEHLEKASSLAKQDDAAILRIASWTDDHVLPDPVAHPTRWLPVWMAVQANQATLALARHQPDRAERHARDIIARDPEASWGHAALGWVLRATGDPQGARDEWSLALESTSDRQDQEAFESWLNALPA